MNIAAKNHGCRGPSYKKWLPAKPACGLFVVHSDERLAYERGEREKAMQRVQQELEALRQRMRQGQLKASEKNRRGRHPRSSHATTDTAFTVGN